MSETVIQPKIDERTETRTRPDTGDGDHDRFAHYVRARDLDKAWFDGKAVVALCGKKWVPTRDPSRYPICKTCAEIRQQIGL